MATKSERREDAAWRKNRSEYVMQCPQGCGYQTPPMTVTGAAMLMEYHRRAEHERHGAEEQETTDAER